MFDLRNDTPFPAAVTPSLDQDGVLHATVLVKGTFRIPDRGREPLVAEEQAPPRWAAEYHGEPGESSIRFDSDAGPSKPATDVALVGTAVSARPVTELDVTLSVGPVRKTVRVTGDRIWSRFLGRWVTSKPAPFDRRPLTYEHAFGGGDTSDPDPARHDFEPRNPVGTGFLVSFKKENAEGLRLPSIEDPAHLISSRKDRPPPAGFGFVAPGWEPRKSRAGTYDEAWVEARAPLLPSDFDVRFHQGAHPDLVSPKHLEGGEPVRISNVAPRGSFDFDLPRLAFEIATSIKGRERSYRPVMDTVLLLPDSEELQVCWRATFPCPRTLLYLDWVRVRPGWPA